MFVARTKLFACCGVAPAGGMHFRNVFVVRAVESPLPGESILRNLICLRAGVAPAGESTFRNLTFLGAVETPLPAKPFSNI